MNSGFSERKCPKDKEFEYSSTDSYAELEIPVDDDTSLFLYLVPQSEHSMYLLMSFDDAFDEIINNLDDDTITSAFRKAWPTLYQLIQDGVNDKYSNCALIKTSDFDDGDTKWFLATFVGNYSLDNDSENASERIQDAIKKVEEKALTLLTELSENSPKMFPVVMKSMWKDFLSGIILSLNSD